MNPTMRNALRWLGALVAAFVWGAITAMTDGNPTWQDLVRHGLMASVPTILALKLTLEKQLGIDPGAQKGFTRVSFLLVLLVCMMGILAYPSFKKRLLTAYHARQIHTVQTSGRSR